MGLLMVGASLCMISCRHDDDNKPRNCDGLYTEKEMDAMAVHTFHTCQMMLRMGTFNDTMEPPRIIRIGVDNTVEGITITDVHTGLTQYQADSITRTYYNNVKGDGNTVVNGNQIVNGNQ